MIYQGSSFTLTLAHQVAWLILRHEVVHASVFYIHCRSFTTVAINYSVSKQVNLNEVCTSGEQLASATKFVTNTVCDKMKANLLAHPTIRWQYFGSEGGVMPVYPSFRQCDVNYDPRFR